MTTPVPANPKIYHIVHIDKLESIIEDGCLWSDGEVHRRHSDGTTIGMDTIKKRRLEELTLTSYPDLNVGECVPFYFCPRSVMLYMFHMNNSPDIAYHGGQEPIVHLVADLQQTVTWANANIKRWAFTSSNAGSRYFDDYANLDQLDKIDWNVVNATYWEGCRETKQAEFLIEKQFPFELIERIGVHSQQYYQKVNQIFSGLGNSPTIEIKQDWYY
jgi:hypothetical protein